ncbi:MAG: carbohydrate-binding protein [Bacillota bacterium]
MVEEKQSRFGRKEEKLLAMRETNEPSGVVVDPIPITFGEEITVLYYGLLDDAGADQVWLRTGYGDAHRWQGIYDYRMDHTDRGWVKTFHVEGNGPLNFCFKDSASNWDNNSGVNWMLQVHSGARV